MSQDFCAPNADSFRISEDCDADYQDCNEREDRQDCEIRERCCEVNSAGVD